MNEKWNADTQAQTPYADNSEIRCWIRFFLCMCDSTFDDLETGQSTVFRWREKKKTCSKRLHSPTNNWKNSVYFPIELVHSKTMVKRFYLCAFVFIRLLDLEQLKFLTDSFIRLLVSFGCFFCLSPFGSFSHAHAVPYGYSNSWKANIPFQNWSKNTLYTHISPHYMYFVSWNSTTVWKCSARLRSSFFPIRFSRCVLTVFSCCCCIYLSFLSCHTQWIRRCITSTT